MAKVHDIRKAFFEEGHSISRIAEQQSIDRKTVCKYLEQEDWNEPAQRAPRCRPLRSDTTPHHAASCIWMR